MQRKKYIGLKFKGSKGEKNKKVRGLKDRKCLNSDR